RKYDIYNNKLLKDFIIHLEEKYTITNEIDFFKELVNFSKNKSIPYHGWFKYREGYSHTLVKELLDRENLTKNEFVIDPFCGSGTTLVEAGLNGFNSFGIDVNPMSAYISNAKSDIYTNEDIRAIKHYIDKMELQEPKSVNLINYEDIRRYFNEKNLND